MILARLNQKAELKHFESTVFLLNRTNIPFKLIPIHLFLWLPFHASFHIIGYKNKHIIFIFTQNKTWSENKKLMIFALPLSPSGLFTSFQSQTKRAEYRTRSTSAKITSRRKRLEVYELTLCTKPTK